MSAEQRGWGPPCKGERVTVRVAGQGGDVKLPVRKEIAPIIQYLVEETQRLGYGLRAGECWGYACRKIRNGNSWSNHAWGLAVDLNAPANPMKKVPPDAPRHTWTDMPEWLPALWKQYGFGWGGDYKTTKDAMHYEFLGTPTQAAEVVRRIEAGRQPVVQPQLSPPLQLPPIIATRLPPEGGVVLIGEDGATYAFGGAQWPGAMPNTPPDHPPATLEAIVAETRVGTGAALLAASGAVYAWGTPFQGGVNGKPYFAGRQVATITPGPKPDGYTITATSGEKYCLPE